MQKIFIDANIFLRFFDSNLPEFKKLLSVLPEISEKIIITHQIIDEVNRNKLNVFRASIQNYRVQSKLNSILLPEHLDSDANPRIKKWNSNRRQLEETGAKLYLELSNLMEDIMLEISESRDSVSKQLGEIFKRPVKVTSRTFAAARTRKEFGNPPGKNQDPIGDELNWVQIMENVTDCSRLLIVSNDGDYFTEYNNRHFLNPMLLSELKNINPRIEFGIYPRLSEGLRALSSEERIQSLPTQNELDNIIELERESAIVKIAHHGSLKMYGGGRAIPIKCPACGSEKSLMEGGYLRSQYGGLTYQFVCKVCGYHYDTGDYSD